MAELLYRIGRFATRRRFVVMGTWLAILAVTVGAFLTSGGAPAGEITIPGTETAKVTDHLAATFPDVSGGSGTVVFHTADGTPFTVAQQTAIAGLVAQHTSFPNHGRFAWRPVTDGAVLGLYQQPGR